MPIETLDKLLEEEIRDLYDAEKQLTKALPKMAKAVSDEELKAGFLQHLEETKGQVGRLEQVFELLELKPKGKPCKAMKGLLEEGAETMQEDAEGTIMDLMIITAAQKVEHYEISGYGTARALAEQIGNQEVADLLNETEQEEGDTDHKLTAIAERLMQEFNSAGEEEEEEEEDGEEGDDEELEEEDEEEAVAVAPAPAKAKKKGR